jgi:uracil-DNA glycosylase
MKESIIEIVEDLGTEIIKCRKKCKGVKRCQDKGYYPQPFFLDSEDTTQIDVLIVGENPGNSSCIERAFYKTLVERSEGKLLTFKDCQMVWRSIAQEHKYYQLPKHLLRELGLDDKRVLWAELVACEKLKPTKESKPVKQIPPTTFENCKKRSFMQLLEKLGKWLPPKTYVLCLGKIAFQQVSKLQEYNHWKIIGVYHPTGSRLFGRYFQKDRDKRIPEQKLNEEIKSAFEKQESTGQSYVWFAEQPQERTSK